MTRYGAGALLLAGGLALGHLWLALVWEGILVGLVLLLLGVAALARRTQAHGFPLADQLGGPSRIGMGFGLPITPPRHLPASPVGDGGADLRTEPAARPVDHRRMIREIEQFLQEHRAD